MWATRICAGPHGMGLVSHSNRATAASQYNECMRKHKCIHRRALARKKHTHTRTHTNNMCTRTTGLGRSREGGRPRVGLLVLKAGTPGLEGGPVPGSPREGLPLAAPACAPAAESGPCSGDSAPCCCCCCCCGGSSTAGCGRGMLDSCGVRCGALGARRAAAAGAPTPARFTDAVTAAAVAARSHASWSATRSASGSSGGRVPAPGVGAPCVGRGAVAPPAVWLAGWGGRLRRRASTPLLPHEPCKLVRECGGGLISPSEHVCGHYTCLTTCR